MNVTRCQVCGTPELELVFDAGWLPLVNTLRSVNASPEPETFYPAQLLLCKNRDCQLVQLGYQPNPRDVFPKSYAYRSGMTKALLANFDDLVADCIERGRIKAGDLVIDVGCNDGVLLERFRAKGCQVAGIEPTDAADDAQAKGLFVLKKYFNHEGLSRFTGWPKAKLVTACNVFAHMPNVHETVDCVKELMADDGFFVMEVHYLPSMLERLQFDVVYHEHLRYYSLTSLRCLLEQHGLEIVDCKRTPAHGGSMRVAAAHKGKHPVQHAAVDAALEGFAVDFRYFREQVAEIKLSLYDVLLERDPGEIWGIGAPSRAVTLIHHFGLDSVLSRVCELPGSKKIGHFIPGTRIPIVDEKELFAEQPPVAIILSWHLADEIAANLRRNGYSGELVIPLPYPRILR